MQGLQGLQMLLKMVYQKNGDEIDKHASEHHEENWLITCINYGFMKV